MLYVPFAKSIASSRLKISRFSVSSASHVSAVSLSFKNIISVQRLVAQQLLAAERFFDEQNQFIGAYPLWGILLSVFSVVFLGRKKTKNAFRKIIQNIMGLAVIRRGPFFVDCFFE